MKSFSFCTVTLLFFLFAGVQLQAQTDNQATFEAYLKKVYDAYENGSDDVMWAYYTDNASEISPDGRLTNGKSAMKASWAEFMTMVDAKPTFTYALTSWRLIQPDVALVTWDSVADIKVQGQQYGGKTSCMAVLHKKKGEWYIEFDTMTPVLEMPADN